MLLAMMFTGFALAVHVPTDEKEHGAQHEGEGSEDEAEEVNHGGASSSGAGTPSHGKSQARRENAPRCA